jgi:ferrous iron transport protein B
VLVFLPVLISLYLALAVLEDSGYMARAAFVMDRHMHALGLHGKSFLPMVIGFGCNVPAIYATRTLDTERDRTLTALLVPFMSCGARLPVYVLLAAVFFPAYGSLVVFGLYLLGIVVAIGLGMVLRHTLFQTQEQAPFIMELPPYRVPTLRNIWFHTWERTSAFIRHAGTMILAASLVVWLLTAIPTGGEGRFADTDIDDSAFALVARTAAPVFAPLGFGSWEASGALVSGVIAKEVVVSTMAQIYGVAAEEEGVETVGFIEGVGDIIGGFLTATVDTLKALPLMVGIDLSGGEEEAPSGGLLAAVRGSFEASSGGHGALAALAFMVFVLLYTPCMATVGALRHELGNRWMWFSVLGQFVVAWVGALIVFQVGLLLGVG